MQQLQAAQSAKTDEQTKAARVATAQAAVSTTQAALSDAMVKLSEAYQQETGSSTGNMVNTTA